MNKMELLLADISGNILDVADLVVGEVEFIDNINKAGTLSFSLLRHGAVTLEEGHAVTYRYDGDTWFCGHVVSIEASDIYQIKIKAYDQLHYLQYKDGYAFKGKTASEIARQLMGDFGLKIGTIEDTGYRLPAVSWDDKALQDMIADALSATLRNTNQYFYIKDDAGLAVLRNIKSRVAEIAIDQENILGYSYKSGIDDGTYNQVKLARDNKDTGKREIYITKDSNNIKLWGLLQYFEVLDDNTNAAQAREKADKMLQAKNRKKLTLTDVQVFGHKDIRAGACAYVDMPLLQVQKYLLCTKASHTFSASGHTLKADFRLV